MYSIMALIFALPMVLFFFYSMQWSQGFGNDIYRGIVSEQMTVVADSVDSDFKKAMEIAGKRALIAAVNWEILKGEALTDSVKNLTELMVNGTINGTENLIMLNNTLADWSNNIASVKTNFGTNLSFTNVSLLSYGFYLEVSALTSVNVTNERMEMRIERKNKRKAVNISLENLDDPLFALNTYGIIHRTIRKYPHNYTAKKIITAGANSSGSCLGELTTDPSDASPSAKILLVSNSSKINDSVLSSFKGVIAEISRNLTISGIRCYNTGNSSAVYLVNSTVNQSSYKEVYIDENTKGVWHLPLRDAVENGYYFEGEGPNITLRMENKTTNSSNGIESFVNLQDFSLEGLPIKENQNSVDYLYFANENYIGYAVRGFPSWLRIDCEKAAQYKVSELLEYSC